MQRFLLLITSTCIFAIGLVLIFNTSSAEILDLALNKSTHHALFKQMLYAILGSLLAFLVWKAGYRNFLKFSGPLLLFFTCLLALVLIPHVGHEVNGSRRWIGLGGYFIQPSEFVKYLVPTYFIHRFLQFEGKVFTLRDFLRLCRLVAIPMALILVEPNNGTVGVIALTLIMLFLLTQVSFKYWAVPLMICVVLGSLSAYNLAYVQARLKVYWNPELDLKGKGHQPHQAKIAAGSGKLIGKGPGNSLQKLSYLPEAQNDYIAAIYAEEFGFFGMALLISLYMILACLGFYISYQSPDKYGFYLGTSVTFLISFQAFMNLGVVSGLLPSTGLNLPLFSQGGSSLMANVMGLGLLLSIDSNSIENRQMEKV